MDDKLLPNIQESPVSLHIQPVNSRKDMLSGSSSSIATTRSVPSQSKTYKVYKRRWYMLSVLAVLNFSNALGWITFAPVADLTVSYYNTSYVNVNWLSLEYMVASIPVGFLSAWILDSFGLRIGLMLGAWLNVVGLAVRYISTIHQLKGQIQFIIVLIGQGVAAAAQPFLLFAPTKLAALWFPESQRAIANTLGSSSNPLGILAAFLLSKVIVKEKGDLPTMLWIYIIPGGVAAAMMTLGFWSSVPPTPPSASAAESSETFLQGLKKILRNRAYLVLLLVFGAGLGLFNTVSSLVEQVLCSKGYDDFYASIVGALMIGGGIVGAVITGVYVDKTKKFEPTAKTCFAVAVLGLIGFCALSCYRDMAVYIAVGAGIFGTFAFGAYPVVMELGVETTFPVAEGTSTGFLFMAGQIQGIILILLCQVLGQDLSPTQQSLSKCQASVTPQESVTPQDLTIPLLVLAGYATFMVCVFLLFFRTTYRRLKAEERHAADSILNFSSHGHGTSVSSPGDFSSS